MASVFNSGTREYMLTRLKSVSFGTVGRDNTGSRSVRFILIRFRVFRFGVFGGIASVGGNRGFIDFYDGGIPKNNGAFVVDDDDPSKHASHICSASLSFITIESCKDTVCCLLSIL